MLYYGFGEQARHEHMSDEYKDRCIIIVLRPVQRLGRDGDVTIFTPFGEGTEQK